MLLAASGCTKISISPSCPSQMAVGESAVVDGHVVNPGAIPAYLWRAIPAGAGSFDDADAPVTNFTAEAAGEATLRLTASDGLYQVIDQCRVTITEVVVLPVAVSLSASPDMPVTGSPVTLTCRSTGTIPATLFEITQTGGPFVSLIPLAGGSVVFTPNQPGSLTFRCIGRSDENEASNPASIVLNVEESGGGGRR
jgi:hypothetical protein